jgi:hypothetical protein
VTSPSPSDSPSKGLGKKRCFLTAEKKFPIYLEAQTSDKPVAKLLRREGLYSTDLARISQSGQGGRSPTPLRQTRPPAGQVSTAAYDAPKIELQDKERALADLSVELAILRKKTRGVWWKR